MEAKVQLRSVADMNKEKSILTVPEYILEYINEKYLSTKDFVSLITTCKSLRLTKLKTIKERVKWESVIDICYKFKFASLSFQTIPTDFLTILYNCTSLKSLTIYPADLTQITIDNLPHYLESLTIHT